MPMSLCFPAGWGQHDTLEVGSFAQDLDSTRVFDVVSGWTDKEVNMAAASIWQGLSLDKGPAGPSGL